MQIIIDVLSLGFYVMDICKWNYVIEEMSTRSIYTSLFLNLIASSNPSEGTTLDKGPSCQCLVKNYVLK